MGSLAALCVVVVGRLWYRWGQQDESSVEDVILGQGGVLQKSSAIVIEAEVMDVVAEGARRSRPEGCDGGGVHLNLTEEVCRMDVSDSGFPVYRKED